jgi:hypothetical protein
MVMNYRSVFSAASCLLVCLCAAGTAEAQTRVDLSVGLKAGVEMSATSEVPELSLSQQIQYLQPIDDSGFFPGFGIGPGFGLAVEARFWEVVGLESGIYYMSDNITGWEDKTINGVDRGRVIMEQESSALHIPLLLKGVAMTDVVRPFLGFGLEFVIQQTSSLEYRAERENPNDATIDQFADIYEARNRIATSTYTLLQLTTGVEIDLGYIRIPIELRAGYNLGWDDSFEARVEVEEQSPGAYTFTSNGENLAHFGFFTGVLYDYDFVL